MVFPWLATKSEQEDSPHLQSLNQNIVRICFLRNFRRENKQLKHKPYELPNVQEMFLNREGFQYTISLDLNTDENK